MRETQTTRAGAHPDLEGEEDDGVSILRDLLPHVTGPEFTVRWAWQAGDIVTWDKRRTVHAARGSTANAIHGKCGASPW